MPIDFTSASAPPRLSILTEEAPERYGVRLRATVKPHRSGDLDHIAQRLGEEVTVMLRRSEAIVETCPFIRVTVELTKAPTIPEPADPQSANLMEQAVSLQTRIDLAVSTATHPFVKLTLLAAAPMVGGLIDLLRQAEQIAKSADAG